MKLKKSNRKRLNNFQKALLIGVPVAGAAIAVWHVTLPQALLLGAGSAVIGTKISNIGYKTVHIDPMSLYLRGHATPGIAYPPPVKMIGKQHYVQSNDSWESLARENNTTVELLLRMNDVPAERVWQIIEANEIPDDLKLSHGNVIYIPVEINGEIWGPCVFYPPQKDSQDTLRFVLPPEHLKKDDSKNQHSNSAEEEKTLEK